MVSLTCFGRLGYFPRRGDVPVEVVEHLRRCLGLAEGTLARCEARNVKAQRRLVRERCDVTVSIPMRGHITSLNVSVAVGVVIFEALRQRNKQIA